MSFVPPPYPYDRLAEARRLAGQRWSPVVDLSVGTPATRPPEALAALAGSGTERGYPPTQGSPAFRAAVAGWLGRSFGAAPPPEAVLACVGTKELVASLPHWLALRCPERDTVLYPQLSYPTYAMGATLAGCRGVAVPQGGGGALDLAAISPAQASRALCLWVNSPSNPTGALDDLGAAAAWGRAQGVPVLSDECYAAFTWRGRPRSILEHGLDGVLAVHSLSKRSNLAGLRAGFCAGDPDLVAYLAEVRKHAGLMVPGPVQAAAAAALADEVHVEAQRARYRQRLERFAGVLGRAGLEAPAPAGGFYLWAAIPGEMKPPAPQDDRPLTHVGAPAWAWAEHLAERAGVLVSPGDLYGPAGAGHVRVAMVAPMEALEVVARRIGA